MEQYQINKRQYQSNPANAAFIKQPDNLNVI